jgi:multiple antibiotic resistance protein
LETVPYALLAFGSLFAIVSPFATVPIFLAVTEHDPPDVRLSMARRASMLAFALLLAFAVLGTKILGAFRVTVPALQIAGGLVILRVAFDMLTGATRRRLTPEERVEALEKDDVAVTPLAVPLLCGPGTMTTGIVLGSQAVDPLHTLIFVGVGAVVYGITYGLLVLAVHNAAYLSPIGLRVTSRVMGLILATIAVQFVLDGIRGAFPSLVAPYPG